ncbi:MAG: AEC family transporter [Spirochaetales bacterium]|nr:AEC family transporter [Spirochaetales bacterium]
MLSLILARRIFVLFIMILMGFLAVKSKLLSYSDGKSISRAMLYIVSPCVIISSFQADFSGNVRQGLLLSLGVCVFIHFSLIAMTRVLGRPLGLTPVERASAIYSNCGNLLIPLVSSIFGPEWVIFVSVYLSFQLVLLWTHGISLLRDDRSLDIRKILSNPTMIAILFGLILLFTGTRLPRIFMDAVDAVGSMTGPCAMLVCGMIIAETDFRSIFTSRRLPLVVVLRLVIYPVLLALLLKHSHIGSYVENGETIVIIALLGASTPSATSIVNMSQLFTDESRMASMINVSTTLLCIVTMPLVLALYQL